MKKSIYALAALGLAAGSACAQSNVTIYGIADVGIARFDTSASDGTWRMDSGNQSGSRLGFRGTEDLGNGLSAIFTLENGYNVDTGTLGQGGRLFGRQVFVGLSSKSIGTLKFGRQYTPMHLAQDAIDPFNVNLAGNMQNVFTANGLNPVGSTLGMQDVRMDNTINFTTPNTGGGFSAEFAYGLGEVAGETSAGRQFGFTLGYRANPFNIVLSHHDANLAAAGAALGADGRATMLGGTYDFGVVNAHGAVAYNKISAAAGAPDRQSRDYMLGVSVPVGGAGALLASYIHHDDRLDAGAIDARQAALGYTYSLSKRTNLYTSFARLDRRPDGALDTNLFNAGIRHRF
jgi:predicted porin